MSTNNDDDIDTLIKQDRINRNLGAGCRECNYGRDHRVCPVCDAQTYQDMHGTPEQAYWRDKGNY